MMRPLHARVAAIAMQRHRSRWQALPNITDDHETYDPVLTVTPTQDGCWVVSSIANAR